MEDKKEKAEQKNTEQDNNVSDISNKTLAVLAVTTIVTVLLGIFSTWLVLSQTAMIYSEIQNVILSDEQILPQYDACYATRIQAINGTMEGQIVYEVDLLCTGDLTTVPTLGITEVIVQGDAQ